MSDGEPGRMTNPTPPVVRHEVFLLAEADQDRRSRGLFPQARAISSGRPGLAR
jgi:hypothetical protein